MNNRTILKRCYRQSLDIKLLTPPNFAFSFRQILAMVDGSGPFLPFTFLSCTHCVVMFKFRSPTRFTTSEHQKQNIEKTFLFQTVISSKFRTICRITFAIDNHKNDLQLWKFLLRHNHVGFQLSWVNVPNESALTDHHSCNFSISI